MNYRTLIRAGSWIIGTILFIGVSVEATRLYVWLMQRWAIWHGTSRGFTFELRILIVPVFALCIIAGALYASAFAKPSDFGGVLRIWLHLIATYLFFLLASALFVRTEFLPLPDFTHELELNSYLFVLFSLPIVCFSLGIFSWAHLAFRGKPVIGEGKSGAASPAS